MTLLNIYRFWQEAQKSATAPEEESRTFPLNLQYFDSVSKLRRGVLKNPPPSAAKLTVPTSSAPLNKTF